jgi:hypothetical protein
MAGYAPWLPALNYQSHHAGHGPGPVTFRQALDSFAAATTSLPLMLAVILGLASIATAIWSAKRSTSPATAADEDRGLAMRLFLLVPLCAFIAAAVLSHRNFLLDVRCLLTITPCLLLAAAHAMASGPVLPRAVITGTLTVCYLSVSMALSGHVKSNAREVARAVAARARPTDVILVEPCFFTSSFLYYCKANSERIALLPAAENAGAIYFDDVEDRYCDPKAMTRLRAQLARAHQEGKRIWLLTDRDNLTVEDVSDSDELPPMHRARSTSIRYNQIRKQLNALYGPPDTQTVPVDIGERWESFRVLLYGTGPPGSERGSIERSGWAATP